MPRNTQARNQQFRGPMLPVQPMVAVLVPLPASSAAYTAGPAWFAPQPSPQPTTDATADAAKTASAYKQRQVKHTVDPTRAQLGSSSPERLIELVLTLGQERDKVAKSGNKLLYRILTMIPDMKNMKQRLGIPLGKPRPAKVKRAYQRSQSAASPPPPPPPPLPEPNQPTSGIPSGTS